MGYFQPKYWRLLIAFVVLACGSSIASPPAQQSIGDVAPHSGPVFVRMSDQVGFASHSAGQLQPWWADPSMLASSSSEQQMGMVDHDVAQAQYQQRILPSEELLPQVGNRASTSSVPTTRIGQTSYFGTFGLNKGARDLILGAEAKTRQATDAGSLLGKSPVALGVDAQRRTPIMTDIRVRGSRVGALLASGSHWVPARMDLDTMLSKIDSRVIGNVTVIKGPYASRYGPGFDFVDVQLLEVPRYQGEAEMHGTSSIDYNTNGEQWYGRQVVWGGDDRSGFRVGYGHSTGNDYVSGDGRGIPSSYKSRDIDIALGRDLSDNQKVEFNYLRLDQTDVEFPGQAFDINWLVTDGFELRYEALPSKFVDQLDLETWYNRTRFEGDNLRPGKRRQFPFYVSNDVIGETDVDSMSTGYYSAVGWEGDSWSLTVGSDLRYVKQELNEEVEQDSGAARGNSPIPRSHQSNPGVFVDYEEKFEQLRVVAGLRFDWVSSNIDDDSAKLADVGIRDPDLPFTSSLADTLGTSDFDRDEGLVATYLTAERNIAPTSIVSLGVGYAERPPTLTELYAAQPFMFLLQSGLNTVTGDPTLAPERRWQFDVGLRNETSHVRSGINGFYAWVHDYITFENLDVFPSVNNPEQVRLRFTNTDLATLAGGEFYTEADLAPRLTVFATLSYLEGRDHDRNGDAATQRAEIFSPLQSVAGQPRGSFSGLTGGNKEPLPGIHPLQSQVGVRVHDPGDFHRWSVEVTARIVSNQDRVAESLLETPTAGFTVWDARGYWKISEKMLLTLGVENFTDQEYREYLDFRPLSGDGLSMAQPGTNFYFGAEVTH